MAILHHLQGNAQAEQIFVLAGESGRRVDAEAEDQRGNEYEK